MRAQDFNPFIILAAIVSIWSIVVLAQLYLTVGVWRAAVEHRWDRIIAGRTGLWGVAAQLVLIVAALNLLRIFVQTAVPELTEGMRMAFLDDPALPPYSMRLMRDGTEAEIAGGFKYGLARDAEKLFASAPQLRVVHLNSAGGRIGEAIKLARADPRPGARHLHVGRLHLGLHRRLRSRPRASSPGRRSARLPSRHLRRPREHRGDAQAPAGGRHRRILRRSRRRPTGDLGLVSDRCGAGVGPRRVPPSSTPTGMPPRASATDAPLAVFENALRQTPLAVLETSEPPLFEEIARPLPATLFRRLVGRPDRGRASQHQDLAVDRKAPAAGRRRHPDRLCPAVRRSIRGAERP